MAHGTPTHEPPEFPDEEVLPEEPAPTGRQLLRMFLPVAAAIVVFITALLLVLRSSSCAETGAGRSMRRRATPSSE